MRPLALFTLCASVAYAEPPKDFTGWEDANQFECNAPLGQFDPPDLRTFEGFRYEHTGSTLKLRREKARAGKAARLGVIAGIKDLEPETRAQLQRFLGDFDKADVDLIVVGGDTAEEPDVLDAIYGFLATATRRPTIAIAGNTERAAAHTYAINKVRKTGVTHLLNGDVIRRVDGDGFDLVTLAGYYDKRYLHLSGGCLYSEKALSDVEQAVAAADDAVVFLSHGPPRQKGQHALDYVPGADNVGDPQLTDLITRAKIPFGIFGHIIEAGGTATDLAGKTLPQKKPQPALYLNQGSCNPLPWKMNDGSTSYGLAAILTVEGKKASYEVLRGPKPAPPAP